MAWNDLKAAVAAVIKTNGNQSITGAVLQSTLNSIIDQVGANASYKGVAIPSTNPGTPDALVFYIASTQGTYANFGGFVLDGGFAVLSNVSGSWTGTNILEIEQVRSQATNKVASSKLLDNELTKQFQSLVQFYKTYNTDWNFVNWINPSDEDPALSVNEILVPTRNATFTNLLDSSSTAIVINNYKSQVIVKDSTGYSVKSIAGRDKFETIWLYSYNSSYLRVGYAKVGDPAPPPSNYRVYFPAGNGTIFGLNVEDWRRTLIVCLDDTWQLETIKSSLETSAEFNITYLYPPSSGYHTLSTAILAINTSKFPNYPMSNGTKYTFEIADGVWKTYRLINRDSRNHARAWRDVDALDLEFENGVSIKMSYPYDNYSASDGNLAYIPVVEGQEVMMHGIRRYVFRDYKNNYVENSYADIPNVDTELNITVPTGASYLYVVVLDAYLPIASVCVKNVLKGYVTRSEKQLDELYNKTEKIRYSSEAEAIANGGVKVADGIYDFNLSIKKAYRFKAKFKVTGDINYSTGSKTIANLTREDPVSSGTLLNSGGFVVIINHTPVEPDALYPVIKQNVSIICSPAVATGNGGARSIRTLNGKWFKYFFGDDCFKLRYLGDITQSANQDVCLDITDTGLSCYHSDDDSSVFTEDFPSNKSFKDFCDSMIARCAIGGNLDGVIEFSPLWETNITTDDIIRCDGIKLVADYTTEISERVGVEAFPFYAPTVDKKYHEVEVIFDYLNAENKDINLIRCYIDGAVRKPIDTNWGFTGTWSAYKTLTVGDAGLDVVDVQFDNGENKTTYPVIFNLYAHNLIMNKVSPPVANQISLEFLKEAISLLEEYGYKYVTYEDIADYVYGKKELPKFCYNIVHDDHLKFRDLTNPTVIAFRNFYKSKNIKFACAQIGEGVSDADWATAVRDDKVQEVIYHQWKHATPTVSLRGMKYDEIIASLEGGTALFAEKYRDLRLMRYHGGVVHYVITRIVREFGFTISTDHPEDMHEHYGGITINRLQNQTKLPLVSIEDSRWSNDVSNLEVVLAKLKEL